MTNAEIFIEKFKELENLIRSKYNFENYESSIVELTKNSQFRHLKDELNYIREIRNLLQHKPKLNGEYPIEPSMDLIETINKAIQYINNPPKAYDKCIKYNDLCVAQWNEKIFNYMKLMKSNNFTHLPIINNGVVEGVFSENTLFSALIDCEMPYEKDITKFSDSQIRRYCEIDNHLSERFEFIKRDAFLEDAKEKFSKSYQNNKQLALLFITENGIKNEKLLGMLTPWDIL